MRSFFIPVLDFGNVYSQVTSAAIWQHIKALMNYEENIYLKCHQFQCNWINIPILSGLVYSSKCWTGDTDQLCKLTAKGFQSRWWLREPRGIKVNKHRRRSTQEDMFAIKRNNNRFIKTGLRRNLKVI